MFILSSEHNGKLWQAETSLTKSVCTVISIGFHNEKKKKKNLTKF